MSEVRICAVTVASDRNHPGLKRLQRSLDHHGWVLKFAGEPGPWLGFHTKLCGVRDLLPKLREENWTHVLFTDAYDTIAVGGPAEVRHLIRHTGWEKGLVMSCEIACWPTGPEDAKPEDYPQLAGSKWKHINSGNYLSEIGLLEKVLEGCESSTDDQRWFTKKYLDGWSKETPPGPIYRDDHCRLFQTLAHVWPWPHQKWSDDFGWDGTRPVNWTTGTRPIFYHMNGGGAANNYAPWLFKEEVA